MSRPGRGRIWLHIPPAAAPAIEEANKRGFVPLAADIELKVLLSDTSSDEGDSVPKTAPRLPVDTGIFLRHKSLPFP